MNAVLLVEHYDLLRAVVRDVLTARGYTVAACEDAVEGLMHCRLSEPDVIVIDTALPGLSGLELCRLLCQSRHATSAPIIVVSSCLTPEVKQAAAEAGAAAVLAKPYSADQLIRVMDAARGAIATRSAAAA